MLWHCFLPKDRYDPEAVRQPDEKILRLSESFPEDADADIEVKVRMLNVNVGRNSTTKDEEGTRYRDDEEQSGKDLQRLTDESSFFLLRNDGKTIAPIKETQAINNLTDIFLKTCC